MSTTNNAFKAMELEARSLEFQRRWHQAQINQLVARLDTGEGDREWILKRLNHHQQQLAQLEGDQ